MRLFVAVELPARARRELAADVADTRAARAAIGDDAAALRWVDPARWHLSVAFLGDVDAAVLTDLLARLARAAGRARPFRLRLAGAGRFDDRVLWAGLRGGGRGTARPDPDLRALHRLAAGTAAAARHAGIPMEERRYRPHLTLARAPRGTDLAPWASALATHAGPAFRVDSLHLVESVLGPAPRYTEVARWPLGRPSRPVDGEPATDEAD